MKSDTPRPEPAPDDGAHLRVLSCNILAGGSVSRYREYVTRSLEQVLPSGKRANLDELSRVIGGFDLVALQESDAGSLRSGFLNQTQYLAETAGFPFWSDQQNRRVSRLAASGNGLLARIEPEEVRDYPLPGRIRGRGALWARFGHGRDELILVVAHLSLGPTSRARQIGFLAELLGQHDHVILMGDLNTPLHRRELQPLFDRTALVPPHAELPTYPSWRPARALDYILTSATVPVERRWVVPHPVSDHLPIAADIRMPRRIARAMGLDPRATTNGS